MWHAECPPSLATDTRKVIRSIDTVCTLVTVLESQYAFVEVYLTDRSTHWYIAQVLTISPSMISNIRHISFSLSRTLSLFLSLSLSHSLSLSLPLSLSLSISLYLYFSLSLFLSLSLSLSLFLFISLTRIFTHMHIHHHHQLPCLLQA